MSLKEITERIPNVQLVITASDLRELIHDWQQESIAQMEATKTASQPPSNDGLLTSKEAQTIMRVSPTTLWKLERQQKLIPVRIGRRVFYKKTDVDKVINKQKG